MSDSNFITLLQTGGVLSLPSVFRYVLIKRIFDVTITLVTLVIIAPFMLLVALVVRLNSRGPALFRQKRIGKGEHEFEIFKFRSMYVDASDLVHRELVTRQLRGDRSRTGRSGTFKLENDARITRVGSWLRRYGVDELPQLLNVLRGEMSLVGPRPSLRWEVDMYTLEQRRRHECLPGITGLWQVSDRYSLSMPEMLALDLLYTETRSLKLDLWILLRSPKALLFGRSPR